MQEGVCIGTREDRIQRVYGMTTRGLRITKPANIEESKVFLRMIQGNCIYMDDINVLPNENKSNDEVITKMRPSQVYNEGNTPTNSSVHDNLQSSEDDR